MINIGDTVKVIGLAEGLSEEESIKIGTFCQVIGIKIDEEGEFGVAVVPENELPYDGYSEYWYSEKDVEKVHMDVNGLRKIIVKESQVADILGMSVKKEINVKKLIKKFDGMAKRESLLARGDITQQDLLMQIIGTIVVVAMEEKNFLPDAEKRRYKYLVNKGKVDNMKK